MTEKRLPVTYFMHFIDESDPTFVLEEFVTDTQLRVPEAGDTVILGNTNSEWVVCAGLDTEYKHVDGVVWQIVTVSVRPPQCDVYFADGARCLKRVLPRKKRCSIHNRDRGSYAGVVEPAPRFNEPSPETVERAFVGGAARSGKSPAVAVNALREEMAPRPCPPGCVACICDEAH